MLCTLQNLWEGYIARVDVIQLRTMHPGQQRGATPWNCSSKNTTAATTLHLAQIIFETGSRSSTLAVPEPNTSTPTLAPKFICLRSAIAQATTFYIQLLCGADWSLACNLLQSRLGSVVFFILLWEVVLEFSKETELMA